MMLNFRLDLPRHIEFGPNSRLKLFELIKKHNYNKILFITGSHWFSESGRQKEFTTGLEFCRVSFLACPPGEPDTVAVNHVLQGIRQFRPDLLVGIGGGSVIDTAKACSVLAVAEDPVEEFLEGIGSGKLIRQAGIPLVAMPTTAGTGAEVTKNAVIKSVAHSVKKSLRSPFLIPAHVIVDPELALDMGSLHTGMAGMDALVQLFEAFVSLKAMPVPKALIKSVFPQMLRALEKLAQDGHDLSARSEAAYGAMLSGIALTNSGLGAVHGFASSLGGATSIPHGLICAVCFIPVLEANFSTISGAVQELLDPAGTIPADELLDQLKMKINHLLELFNLREALTQYSLKRSLIPGIADKATGSSMSGNPRLLNNPEREEILIRALGPIIED